MNSSETRKPKRAAASHKAAKRSAARFASGSSLTACTNAAPISADVSKRRQEAGDVGIGIEREHLDVEHA